MFEKLLGALPYNPSMASQLAFYGRRMREEASLRRLGLIFMVLAFMVQFLAVLQPPQSTSAASSNDLINGGISNAADGKAQCVRNTQDYKAILRHYGIDCDAFDSAVYMQIASNGQDYYSAGRNPQGTKNNATGRLTHETPVQIGSNIKVYFRTLDSFGTTTYTAWRVRNTEGTAFYILKDCANLVSVGPPAAPATFTPGGVVSTPAPVSTPTPTPTPAPAPAPTPATPATPTPATPTPTPVTPMCTYNSSLPANSPLCFQPCQYNASIPATDAKCYNPCQYNPNIPDTDVNCKPCDKSVSTSDAYACVSVRKAASNDTAKIADANNTTASAGDVITYTLYAENSGKATVKNYVFQETLSDVLDYADVVDLHGGTMDAAKTVTWPAENIEAGKTASHQVTVKVKTEIPATPTGSSDPMHFDLLMTNVYGNAVNIKVPAPPAKAVEVVAATLPNTGPGTTLFIATSIVIIAGYFYGRARLLATESDIAVKEAATN